MVSGLSIPMNVNYTQSAMMGYPYNYGMPYYQGVPFQGQPQGQPVSQQGEKLTLDAQRANSRQVADYLSNADQYSMPSLSSELLCTAGFMGAPAIYRTARHPFASLAGIKSTQTLLKGVNFAHLPKEQAVKAVSNIYKANRLMALDGAIAGTKQVADPTAAKKLLAESMAKLQKAMAAGNTAEIAKCTGELEGLINATKRPNIFVGGWRAVRGVKPAATADIVAASEKAGTAAAKTFAQTSTSAAKATSIGAKISNGLRVGGAIPMAIIEGLIEGFEVANTASELGAGAAIRQAGKSAVKVGASVGGWIGGAKAGMAAGAAIGTMVPGIGTLIGGTIGTIIGGCLGCWGAKKIASTVVGESELALAQKEKSDKITAQLMNNPQSIAEANTLIAQKVQEEGESEASQKAIAALTKIAESGGSELPMTQPQATPGATNPEAMPVNPMNLYNDLCVMTNSGVDGGWDITDNEDFDINKLNYMLAMNNANAQYQNAPQNQAQQPQKMNLQM